MFKNWRTTLAATLASTAYAVLSALSTGGISGRDIALTAGIAAIGTLAKDFNVTGS